MREAANNLPTSQKRHPEVLVAPLVTFLVVIGLLLIARVYDHLPVQAPDCTFKTATGIPCVGCGGTRAMQSLAFGEIVRAVQFNPAVVLGVSLSGCWFASGLFKFLRGGRPLPSSRQNRKLKQSVFVVVAILAANWIYLIKYLE